MKKKLIAIDFDGVLHSLTSGWQGVRVISDPPVGGAIIWLKHLLTFGLVLNVCIFSARNFRWGGKRAMKRWLLKYGLTKEEVSKIKFPILKPGAALLIDDRVFCFYGRSFPTVAMILNFEPWHGQSIWGEDDNE